MLVHPPEKAEERPFSKRAEVENDVAHLRRRRRATASGDGKRRRLLDPLVGHGNEAAVPVEHGRNP